jgi:hypothetical protein
MRLLLLMTGKSADLQRLHVPHGLGEPGRPQRQFQAWDLDPRKRRDAQGRASPDSRDQDTASSDGAQDKVGREN